MVRQSLLTKSFSIASDELERARYLAKEKGVSLNRYLRLAVVEKNRGVVLGLEAMDTLNDIKATVREAEARNALALECLLADLRAEHSSAIRDNEKMVIDVLKGFSKFLAQAEPDSPQAPARKASSASPPSESSANWQRHASRS